MKNGFTLVELLAVIVVLAIISLIAIPQVLQLIEKSRIKSIEISVSEYIRAVNTSIMNEEMNNNVSDGLYIINDSGKVLKLNDKKINVEYKGKGLESGGLLVENKKVVRIIKGKIDKYYSKLLEDNSVELYKDIKENMLVNGDTFNTKIKTLVNDIDTPSTSEDNTLKEVEFYEDGLLPKGYTKESLESLKNIDVSQKQDGSVIAYYDGDNTVYIYSEGYILGNASCARMFKLFKGLLNIKFNLFDTSKVTTMYGMFSGCSSLTSININDWDISNLTSLYGVFDGCSSLTSLDLSNWDTSSVTNMTYMFVYCSNLKEIKFGKGFDTSSVTGMWGMFLGCSSLTELDLSNFSTSSVENMYRMFEGCKNLKEIKFGKSFDTSKVTTMQSMFSGCSSLTSLDLSNWNTSSVTNMTYMFVYCSNLKEIKFGKGFDTSSVTGMWGMFLGCSSLTELDLSNFSTSSVENMYRMFEGCKNLKELDVSNFDTSKVTTMKSMFSGCSSLTKLDLSNFDTSSVTDMIYMFNGCTSLSEIKVSRDKWIVNDEIKQDGMFKDCGTNEVTYIG